MGYFEDQRKIRQKERSKKEAAAKKYYKTVINEKLKEMKGIKTKEEFLEKYHNTDLFIMPQEYPHWLYIELNDLCDYPQELKDRVAKWLEDKEFFLQVCKAPNHKSPFWIENIENDAWSGGPDYYKKDRWNNYDILSISPKFEEVAKTYLTDEDVALAYVSGNAYFHTKRLKEMGIYPEDSFIWLHALIQIKNTGTDFFNESDLSQELKFTEDTVFNLREYERGGKLKEIPVKCFTKSTVGLITRIACERAVQYCIDATKDLSEQDKVDIKLQEMIDNKVQSTQDYIAEKLAENLKIQQEEAEAEAKAAKDNDERIEKERIAREESERLARIAEIAKLTGIVGQKIDDIEV